MEESKELWGEAAQALKLSTGQRQSVLRLRSLYLERQQHLQQERQVALSGLLASAPDNVRGRDIATQFIKVRVFPDHAVAYLHCEQLRAAHIVCVELQSASRWRFSSLHKSDNHDHRLVCQTLACI